MEIGRSHHEMPAFENAASARAALSGLMQRQAEAFEEESMSGKIRSWMQNQKQKMTRGAGLMFGSFLLCSALAAPAMAQDLPYADLPQVGQEVSTATVTPPPSNYTIVIDDDVVEVPKNTVSGPAKNSDNPVIVVDDDIVQVPKTVVSGPAPNSENPVIVVNEDDHLPFADLPNMEKIDEILKNAKTHDELMTQLTIHITDEINQMLAQKKELCLLNDLVDTAACLP